MLRISVIETGNETSALRLEGRVMGPWVAEVRRLCKPLLESRADLTLDLSEVSFIDVEGLALFQELRDRHVVLSNCSPFVAEQLKGVTS
jgi:ABC-type transporter Mla MlaB component